MEYATHMKNKPLISVAMGVHYRRSDTTLLNRSIKSILNQSLKNFEFLICEYGSSEQAKRELEELAKHDDRIQLIKGRKPGTLSHNLNDCLRVAQGQYFARMDDDDLSYPDRFEKQVAYLTEHKNISFVGCNVVLNYDGMIAGKRCFPELPTVRDFFMTQPYIHPAIMFRREDLVTIGGYSESPSCTLCEDYDLLLRLYEKGFQGANLQEFLLEYSIVTSEKGKRTLKHRWYETVTRFRHFRLLKLFPMALPYVVKPLLVGLMPACIIAKIKNDGEGKHAIIFSRNGSTTENQ